MTSEDEYDLFDSGRGATLFEDAKAPFDGLLKFKLEQKYR
jgi:hypothetical protein